MAYLVDEWVVLYWVHLQVMEQFFSLVNMFLQNHRDTSERRLRIRTYKVETKFMNLNLIKRFAPFLFIIVLRYLHVHLSFSLYLLCSLHKILTSLCNLGCSLHPKCWCCWMGKRDCSSCWISCGKVFCVHGSCYFMQYTLQMLYIYVVFSPLVHTVQEVVEHMEDMELETGHIINAGRPWQMYVYLWNFFKKYLLFIPWQHMSNTPI